MLKDGAFLMASVAEFQSLAESLLKLNLAATDLASSFQISIELVLSFLVGLTSVVNEGIGRIDLCCN